MEKKFDFDGLCHKCITQVDTQLGYLQILEYVLQDKSYLHIVAWYFKNNIDEKTKLPKVNYQSFYNEEDIALKFAHEIGNNLLQQYLL